jgi:hypothetical protein
MIYAQPDSDIGQQIVDVSPDVIAQFHGLSPYGGYDQDDHCHDRQYTRPVAPGALKDV